jgi:hypothetical protein
MESNPYNSPSANLFGSSSQTTTEAVPSEAITQLQRTKPWVRFFGVMMWIATGLMLLGGIAVGIGAIAGLASAQTGMAEKGMLIGMAAAYVVFGFLYLYPSMKIWAYGTAIGKLAESRSAEDLVKALDQQRAFWKFIGVMMIIMFVIYFVAIVVMIAVGASGALSNLAVPK